MNEFSRHFESVASRFVRNVVVVDEQAFMGEDERTEHLAAQMIEDDLDGANEPLPMIEDNVLKIPPTALQPLLSDTRNILDVKPLIDAFAEKGIFCAILRPQKSEKGESLTRLTENADIVIMDWWFFGQSGPHVRDYLRRISRSSDSRRLRLLVIYTGKATENDLDYVMREIGGHARRFFPDETPDIADRSLCVSGLKVVVYGKRHKIGQTAGESESLRTPKQLADACLRDFASLYEGLVPGVVLSGLSALREQSLRLANAFGASLDPGYLWHRASQRYPSEAEDFLVAMLASEIESVLEDSKCTTAAGSATIRKWLQSQDADWKKQFACDTLTLARLEKLLTTGADPETRAGKTLLSKLKKKTSKPPFFKDAGAFCVDKVAMDDANSRFAMRSILRTQYGERKLRLGAILSSGAGQRKRFWLCLQPLCDSVRIASSRKFPLLPL
ncbi:MAG: response regulator receiver domain [Vulcanimicrobiaceae bacterium]